MGSTRGRAAVVVLTAACVALGGAAWRTSAVGGPHSFAFQAGSFAVLGLALLVCAWSLATGRRREELALAVSAVALSMYAGEAVLAWREPPRDWLQASRRVAELAGRPFDARSDRQVVDDERAAGREIWPFVNGGALLRADHPAAARLRPLAGVSHRRVTVCWQEITHVTRTDRYGFRNPDPIWDAAVSLVLVGDSFVHGICVSDADTLGGRLRALDRPTLALGVPGQGPLSELASIVEYAEALRPPLVAWIYYEGNDLADLEREAASAALRRYLDPGHSQHLRQRQPEIDAVMAEAGAILEAAEPPGDERPAPTHRLLRFAMLARLRERLDLVERPLPPQPAPDALLRRVLTLARDRVTGWGGRLLFVYLPEWARYAQGRDDDDAFRHRARVVELARELGLPTLDIGDAFGLQPDPLALFALREHNTHYSPEGYELVARTLDRRLSALVASADGG